MKPFLHLTVFFLLFFFWAGILNGAAAESSPEGEADKGDALPTVELEKTEVVATPLIQGNQTDRFGGQKTTVSRNQVEDLNAQDLSSALRTTPGVNITRYNVIGSFGGGSGGAVFVRGLGSSRPGGEITTLIDGVPIANSVWNHPLLDLNPVTIADSISVYKGNQPARFGNTFSAINMIPKHKKEDGFTTKLSAAYGRYDTILQTAEHGGKIDRFDYYVGQGFRESNGHRRDADGQLTDYHVNLGYELNDNWRTRFFILHANNYANDLGPRGRPEEKDGRYETRQWLTTLSLSNEYKKARGQVKVYWNTIDGDWRNQAANADNTLNTTTGYGIRAQETIVPWDDGEILLGTDLDYNAGRAKFTYDDNSPNDRFGNKRFYIFSPYCGINHQFGERNGFFVIPSGGLRYYEHSDFDGGFSPFTGLVAGYRKTELHATYSRGRRYPGLDVVVFSQSVLPFLPDDAWEELDPETVDHYETGISQGIGNRLKADVTLFYNDGKDRYVFTTPPAPGYDNIETFSTRGVETSCAIYPVENLSLFGGATYLDPSPSDLPYAPKWTFNSGITYQLFQHFHISVDSQYVKKMYAAPRIRKYDTDIETRVGSYFLLNSKISYTFTIKEDIATGEVFVAGSNLTDADYEYQKDYPMPGPSFMGGVSLRF